jgi:hypothetical protein
MKYVSIVRGVAIFGALLVITATPAHGQSLDNDQGAIELPDSPASPSDYPVKGAAPSNGVVGRKAAQKYMGAKTAPQEQQQQLREQRQEPEEPRRAVASLGPDAHYLSVYIGTYLADNAYQMGQPSAQTNVGRWKAGVTYRFGEWLNSADLSMRIEVENYTLSDGSVRKISFTPIVSFPDATSKFPLYFGGGIGPGIFLQQIDSLSVLSLDYTLFAGVRFFDILKNTGAFVEAGLKNDFLLLSTGQFNGYYTTVGAIFTF